MKPNASTEPWLRLYLTRGVGPQLGRKLVARFGDALWDAEPGAIARVPGVGPQTAAAIARASAEAAQRLKTRCQALGVAILTPSDPAWPERLEEAPGAPLVLFVAGNVEALRAAPQLAVVGARKALAEARRITQRWCAALAERGAVITSGLAYGIDAAAHEGALAAQGRTIAVIGGGLMRLMPWQQRLARRIVEAGGCVVSEHAPDVEPQPAFFPQRNRIIAALADAVLVAQAGERSGALITARLAADYGRDVWAMPGPVWSEAFAGAHRLIQEGAMLAADVADLMRALGLEAKAAPSFTPESDEERKVWDALAAGPLHVDALAHHAGLTLDALLPILLALEMKGAIVRLPGDRYGRA
ncbi:MAG: DNA-protecting protein DprA [Zetaproteobacteria bacterium]|nr:MAG: DNA-protecting protein DprA [Zetaproteobacteria bacterium]